MSFPNISIHICKNVIACFQAFSLPRKITAISRQGTNNEILQQRKTLAIDHWTPTTNLLKVSPVFVFVFAFAFAFVFVFAFAFVFVSHPHLAPQPLTIGHWTNSLPAISFWISALFVIWTFLITSAQSCFWSSLHGDLVCNLENDHRYKAFTLFNRSPVDVIIKGWFISAPPKDRCQLELSKYLLQIL